MLTKLLDLYLCKYLHNPLIWGSLVIIGATLIYGHELKFCLEAPQIQYLLKDDYVFDLAQNLVTLLFVYRFSLNKTFGLQGECTMFAILNIGLWSLMFDRRISLLHANINLATKLFVWWQIISPFVIFGMNLLEYLKSRCGRVDDGEELYEKQKKTDENTPCFASLIKDANNDLLPIFISHSFACINFNFQYNESSMIINIYKVSVLMLKFHCIYRYLLYEVVHVVYDLDETRSYLNLWQISKNTERESFLFSESWHIMILLLSIGTCVTFDCIFLLLFYV